MGADFGGGLCGVGFLFERDIIIHKSASAKQITLYKHLNLICFIKCMPVSRKRTEVESTNSLCKLEKWIIRAGIWYTFILF